MDAITGAPMEQLLKELPISDEICQALMGDENQYQKVLNLVIAVEQGQWSTVTEKCQHFQLKKMNCLQSIEIHLVGQMD